MFICGCLPVWACDALFLYCVWCSSENEQQGLRESLLTGSDGKLWNGNKVSCHYSTNFHSHTHMHSKTAMITDKRANNISRLSLADGLNSNCYERHIANRASFWMLTNTAATKRESISLKSCFFFVEKCIPQISSLVCNITSCCVQGETSNRHKKEHVLWLIVTLKTSLPFYPITCQSVVLFMCGVTSPLHQFYIFCQSSALERCWKP